MTYVVRFEIDKDSNAYLLASHAYLGQRLNGSLSVGHHDNEGRLHCTPNDKPRAAHFDTIADAAAALMGWDHQVRASSAGKLWVLNPQIVEG